MQMTALDVLWVGAGGSLGSLLRWWTGHLIGERYRTDFPLGTFLINLSGAFAMGFLSVFFMVDWHTRHGTALSALCLTGVIGGFTTFSSMQLDAAKLAGHRGDAFAVFYVLISVVAGLLAAAVGAVLARLHS